MSVAFTRYMTKKNQAAEDRTRRVVLRMRIFTVIVALATVAFVLFLIFNLR